ARGDRHATHEVGESDRARGLLHLLPVHRLGVLLRGFLAHGCPPIPSTAHISDTVRKYRLWRPPVTAKKTRSSQVLNHRGGKGHAEVQAALEEAPGERDEESPRRRQGGDLLHRAVDGRHDRPQSQRREYTDEAAALGQLLLSFRGGPG